MDSRTPPEAEWSAAPGLGVVYIRMTLVETPSWDHGN